MKKHNVFLLFTSLTALLFCACSSELKEKENASSKPGTVTLSIANDTQRTISPAAGISYKDVREWTVTFKDITESRSEKYNDIVKTVSFSESANQQIQLPLGTYAVIFKGDVTKQVTTGDETSEASTEPQTVPFYGESTVTVEDGKSASVSVFVSPKKSADGTGSFNYIVNIDGIQDCPPSPATETQGNYFAAKLIPYNTENEIALNYSVNPQQDNGNIYTLTVTNDSVKSGFYQLSIKYIWETCDSEKNQITKDKEIYYPYYDFLVEIVDGLPTNGSVDITVSLEDSKTYYATTGETKGNGAFESLPKNLDELLDDIKDPTISKADIYDIYMVDKIDLQNQSYPEIDVSKVNEAGKTYNISTISDGEPIPCYRITGAGEGNYPTIVPFVNIINLKDNSSVPGKTLNVRDIYSVLANGLHLVLKNSTSVAIDYSSTDIIFPVYLDNTDSFEYYLENPFIIATNVPENSEFVGVTNPKYTIVAKSISDTETGYCIIPVSSANPSINGIDFSLKAEKNGVEITTETELSAGDTVVIKATPENGAFLEGTSFEWFINGKKTDCTAQTYTITFGEGDAVQNNRIICLVGYGTEYATATIEFNNVAAKTTTVVLYNNTSDTTVSSLSYATLTSSGLSTPKELLANTNEADAGNSTKIVDFCFDTSNNMYAIVKQTGENITYSNITYSINKYEYNGSGYSNTPIIYDCIINSLNYISHIEAADNDTLYAGVGTDSGEKIAKITFTAPTEISKNGTATFTPYDLSITYLESYSIYTFCTDTDGTNFYIITNIDGTYELASYTVTEDTLSKGNSITLVSRSDENGYSSDIFSTIPTDNLPILVYSDICYINDTLYLLVKELNGPSTTALYSRGALCTFTVSESEIKPGSIDIGYQTTEGSISYTGDYNQNLNSYPTVTQTSYFGDGQTTFYGPVKFVARKQDELIIADDGFSMVSEDYTKDPARTQATVSSKNAVVTYNLNKESLNFVSLDGEYFEEKYSGYFYGSGFTGN